MLFKYATGAIAALALGAFAVGGASAQDTVKIGLIISMTGPQASTGKQVKAAVDLYMAQHGDTVAGKKIEVILRDSGSVPDHTKRLAQELIVNDHVNIIAGFEITPAALVAAPLATKGKVVEVVMAAGTSIITERSPNIVRTSFTVPQSCRHHRRLGGAEQDQEGRHHRLRLCARFRRREVLQHSLQETRRPNSAIAARAARQSRLLAVPAACRRR